MKGMFHATNKSTNLSHQIIQRETNNNENPKAFASNLFRKRFRIAKNLYKTDLTGHFGCVNAIEFSHGGKYLASGGDDKRVLVWNIEKSLAGVSIPRALATEQASNIFCLGFDSRNQKLISGGNDTLAISHDFETGKLDNVFKHDGPVYGLSIDPQNDNMFATASENGEILLFDQRSTISTVIASVPSSFHAVEFHPTMGNLLVTANSKRGATLYDIRKPKQPVILYGNLGNPRSCMSVRFNRTGNLILGLRRRLPPILYDVKSPDPICTFYHSNYYNSCTMKSCTFAGEDDEMVISGSDDFNLYVWRLSDIDLAGTEQWVESTQMVLYGHRSIVNQVRYNRQKCLLASSGVEKIIKVWSPFPQHNWTGSLTEEALCSDNPRELYSPYNLFTTALPENWHNLSHDYSSENTNEDPRMMAFFDSLIQQEIEEWETISSTDISQEEDRSISSFFSCRSTTSSSSSSSSNSSTSRSSSSSSSSDSDSDNENNRALNKRRRRSKRQAIIRKRIEVKRNNKKSTISKITLNQLHKPSNRIAYLIAKKRNTLRRLAIKEASLNNNCSNKLVVAVNGRKRIRNSSHRQRPVRRRQERESLARNHQNIERPTTSAAAAAALTASKRFHHRVPKNKPKIKTDSNDSSEENSGQLANSSSSRSNAANSLSFNNNHHKNNVSINVPSTSTGITSNFRDAFLRMSRQVFMSDSEDDDDHVEGDDSNKQNNINSRNEELHEQKSNGMTKATNSNTWNTTYGSRTKSNQRPRNSAALNVINKNKTILPQRNLPTNNEFSFINNNNLDGIDQNCGSSSSNKCSNINGRKRMGSSFDSSDVGKCSSKSCKKRPCQNPDSLEDFTVTSSRNPDSSCRTDLFEETTTSTSPPLIREVSPMLTENPQPPSPTKKRKISIKDYIKLHGDLNNGNLQEELEEREEIKNDKTSNNNMFSVKENINNDQLTPQKSNLTNTIDSLEDCEYTFSLSQHNNNNNNSHMFTPDSGISLNHSSTPSTIDRIDIQASTSTTSSRIVTYLSPCYENNDCDVKNEENNEDDESVTIIKKRKTNLNKFQQKVARVRRNYRKQFFDDTESD